MILCSQVEQVSLGTAYRMIHDILYTIIWGQDNPERLSQQRQSARNPYSGVERKSVNKFFREQMENRFMLNKDPDSVNVLVDNMKKDFHKNARDGMTPNRVIFFSGASQFYKTLYSTPQGQYWKTGWRDGSSFNPLEAEVNGMTYCESFDVKQGDWNQDHDPFDDSCSTGAFTAVNSQLWRKQMRDGVKFDGRLLNIKTLNGDSDMIEEMEYRKYLPYTGMWHDYQLCIQTHGQVQSRLSEIGLRLVGNNITYADFMTSTERGRAEYQNRIRRMAANKDFVQSLRTTANLGFFGPSSSIGLPSYPGMDEEEERKEGESAPAVSEYSGRAAAWANRRSAPVPVAGTQARRRQRDDDDEEDDRPKKPMNRRLTKMDNVFRNYLSGLPGNNRELVAQFDMVLRSASPSTDAAMSTWAEMAKKGTLMDHQLLAAAQHVQKQDHLHYPLSAVEQKALHDKSWSNASQDTTGPLAAADELSTRWAPKSGDVSVYVDPHLNITAEVHQTSGALTLTSAYNVLFAISREMLDDALKGDATAELELPSGADMVKGAKGLRRRARLQHSLNLSYAFAAIRDAAATEPRALLQKDSADQQRLIGRLKKLVVRKDLGILKAASDELRPAPIQSPLAYAVDKSNALVKFMYHNPDASDKQVMEHVAPILKYLSNKTKYIGEEDGVEDSETSGVAMRAARYGIGKRGTEESYPALNASQRETLNKVAEEASMRASEALKSAEAAWLKHSGPTGRYKDTQPANHKTYRLSREATDLELVYRHYAGIGVNDAQALEALRKLLSACEQVYMKNSAVFGGVDPLAVVDALVAKQFEQKNSDEIAQQNKELDVDIHELEHHLDNSEIRFKAANSLVGQIVKTLKADNDTARKLIEGLDASLAEVQQILANNPGGRRGAVHDSTKHYIVHMPKAYKVPSVEVPRKLAELLSRYVRNKNTLTWESFLHHSYITEAEMIAAIVVYGETHNGADLAGSDAAMARVPEPLHASIERLSAIWGRSPTQLPSPAQAQAILDAENITDATNEAAVFVDHMLRTIPMHDCRIQDLLVHHNEEPVIGLLYFWPWIQMIGSHVAMVRDGELGNVMYIEPDCLLSENGQQKLIFFHMSMYFKAVITNYRAITRTFFAYCRAINYGWNHSPWNPLDSTHREAVRQYGEQASRDHGNSLFVIPTHIDRDVQANHMSITGKFDPTFKIIQSEKDTTSYEVAETLQDIWGWSADNMIDCFDTDANRRFQATQQRFSNVIMSRCHTESFDVLSQRFSEIIVNAGVMGPAIYDGCIAEGWSSKGRLNKDKRGSTALQLTAGGR